MVPTTLRYKLRPLTKTEVVCNYNKGASKLTLWMSYIECIQESGVCSYNKLTSKNG